MMHARLRFTCPSCSRPVSAPLKAVGKQAICPGCRQACTVPAPGPQAPGVIEHAASATEGALRVTRRALARADERLYAWWTPKPIRFACPGCGMRVAAPPKSQGQEAECPGCHAVCVVPIPGVPTCACPTCGARGPLFRLMCDRCGDSLDDDPDGVVDALRPLNTCVSCRYSWRSRGRDFSRQCPNCRRQRDERDEVTDERRLEMQRLRADHRRRAAFRARLLLALAILGFGLGGAAVLYFLGMARGRV